MTNVCGHSAAPPGNPSRVEIGRAQPTATVREGSYRIGLTALHLLDCCRRGRQPNDLRFLASFERALGAIALYALVCVIPMRPSLASHTQAHAVRPPSGQFAL